MAKRSICFMLVFVMLLSLTGCMGAKETFLSKDTLPPHDASTLQAKNTASLNGGNETIDEIGALYKGVPLPIPEEGVFFVQATRIDEDIFLLGSSKDIPCLYKTDISGSLIEKIEYNESEMPYTICEGTGDNLTLLSIDESGKYILVTQTINKMWEKITLPMLQEYEESTITKIFKIESGYIVFTTAEILILDERGNLVKNMGSYYSFGTCIPLEDSTILLITEVKSIQRNGEQITKTQILDANYNVLDSYTSDSQFTAFYKDLDSNQSTVLAEKDDIIYRFDYKNDTKQALINTLSSSMHVNSLIYIVDDTYFAVDNRKGPSFWKPASGEMSKQLILATYNLDPTLKKLVTAYNESSSEYKITVMDYAMYDEAGAGSQGYTVLVTDIIGGYAPDIFDLAQLPAEIFAERGLLENLKLHWSNEATINYSDLVQSAVKALEYNEGLYYICPSFEVITLCGNPDFVGTNGTWTPDDFFLAVDGLNAVDVFGSEMTKNTFLYYLMVFLEDEYVDKKTCTCNFENTSFQQFLSFAAALPDEIDYSTATSQSTAMAYVGEQQLLVRQIGNDAIALLSIMDTIFGGESQYVGFPTYSSNGVALMPHALIGMSSNSTSKEGVWDFIYFILGSGVPIQNCPLVNEQLEKRMDIWEKQYLKQTPVLNTFYNNLPMKIEGKTDINTAKDRLWKTINRVDCLTMCDETLLNIIISESQPFFSGDISVQQASASIQSRANIYISEQYG